MTTALALAPRTPARLVRDVLGLFKLRIGVMIMLTALVGFAFTPGPALSSSGHRQVQSPTLEEQE